MGDDKWWFDTAGKHPEGDLRGLGWGSEASVAARHQLLCSYIARDARVIDVGCGYGDLYRMMTQTYGFEGEYLGVDVQPKLIDYCTRKFPEAVWLVADMNSCLADLDLQGATVVLCGTLARADMQTFESVVRAVTERGGRLLVSMVFDPQTAGFRYLEGMWYPTLAGIVHVLQRLDVNFLLEKSILDYDVLVVAHAKRLDK